MGAGLSKADPTEIEVVQAREATYFRKVETIRQSLRDLRAELEDCRSTHKDSPQSHDSMRPKQSLLETISVSHASESTVRHDELVQ